MASVQTKKKIKKGLTRLASPFSSVPSGRSSSAEVESFSNTDPPLIHIRTASEPLVDQMMKPNSSANGSVEASLLSLQPYNPSKGLSSHTLPISRPLSRASMSSSSLLDLNCSPSKNTQVPINTTSTNGSLTGHSARYLTAQGKDHAFLLSHGKSGSTHLQMPVARQTASYGSSYSTTSSTSFNVNNMISNMNLPTGVSQLTLPTVNSHNPNDSHYSLSYTHGNNSNAQQLSGGVSNPSLGKYPHTRSATSTPNNSIPAALGNMKLNSKNGGLLRIKKHHDHKDERKKDLIHNHPHHSFLLCPFIQKQFSDLEKSFETGIEQRIEQIESENSSLVANINSVSEHLDILCSEMERQLGQLDSYLLALDSKVSTIEENDNLCMKEDFDDLIKRIDFVNSDIIEKKESLSQVQKRLDHLQLLKENNKVSNIKRRKIAIILCGLLSILIILRLNFL